MLWFIIVIVKFLFKEEIYCCQSEIGQDRTSNTFRHVFVSCWTQWLLTIHMCLLIPLEGKNPDMKNDLLINSSWIWKGKIFLVQLSGRGCLCFPAEVLHRPGGQNDPHSWILFSLHCSAWLCIIKPQTALLTWAGAYSSLRLVTACSESWHNSQCKENIVILKSLGGR